MAETVWLLGVLFAFLACCINNLGVNLQKLVHIRLNDRAMRKIVTHGRSPSDFLSARRLSDDRSLAAAGAAAANVSPADARPKKPPHKTVVWLADKLMSDPTKPGVPYWKEPLWMFAFFFQIVGALLDFAALAFAAQSLIAPIGSLTLAVNCYMAPLISGEDLNRRDVISTVIIVAGAVVSVAFASHEDLRAGPPEIFQFYASFRFLIYAGFITCIILSLGAIIRFIDRLRLALASARQAPIIRARAELKSLLRMLFGAIAGISGAHSVMFAKGVSVMARDGFFALWVHVESFLLIGGLAGTLALQVKFLNDGLARYDALVIVPIFEVFWIAFGVISGLVVYRESEYYSPLSAAMFTLGIGITLFGVHSLSWGRLDSLNERANSHVQVAMANLGGAAAVLESDREDSVTSQGRPGSPSPALGASKDPNSDDQLGAIRLDGETSSEAGDAEAAEQLANGLGPDSSDPDIPDAMSAGFVGSDSIRDSISVRREFI